MEINFSLRIEPDPLLYQKLEDINLDEYDLELIEKSMIQIMNESNGIGISANQVGFNRRVIIVKPRNKEPFAMFNPRIVDSSNPDILDHEGCLSFPDLYLPVKRYNTVTVEFVDKYKNSCKMLFEGYDAKCVQHEIDHLDGICFTSKVSKLKLDLARKKQRKIQNGRTK
jgi:peptide deformylase